MIDCEEWQTISDDRHNWMADNGECQTIWLIHGKWEMMRLSNKQWRPKMGNDWQGGMVVNVILHTMEDNENQLIGIYRHWEMTDNEGYQLFDDDILWEMTNWGISEKCSWQTMEITDQQIGVKWCKMDNCIQWLCQATGDWKQLDIMTDNGEL